MKKRSLLTALLAVTLATGGLFAGSVTIQVTPSSAPNAFGSTYWGDYVNNAVMAQYLGLSSYGDPTLPSYYSVAPSSMDVSQNVVTGFPSWNGMADPGTVFGPNFATELGNRLHFGLDIKGNGNLISIDNVGFSAYSSDPLSTLTFTFGLGSYSYSNSYRGLLYGGDGIKGTADDVWITSGLASQQVNEIIGRGSGNAWPVYTTDPGATEQDKIDGVKTLFGLGEAGFDFVGTYTYAPSLGGEAEIVSGSVTVHFNGVGVPDGGMTASMIGLSILGCMIFRRP